MTQPFAAALLRDLARATDTSLSEAGASTYETTLEERARLAGLWVTARRLAVFRVLEEAADTSEPLRAEEIAERARRHDKRVSIGATRTVLRRLREAALVVRRYRPLGVTYEIAPTEEAIDAVVDAQKWFGKSPRQ